jgi:hypothetical protein
VNSSFFEIRGRLRLDDVALEEVAVVQRATDVRGRYVRTLSARARLDGAGSGPVTAKTVAAGAHQTWPSNTKPFKRQSRWAQAASYF